MQPICRCDSWLHKGCKLSYEVHGAGPPVVFIQGLGIHGCAWKPQIDALAARYECLSFDNRGIGLSQPRGAAITIEQMAEDALALMDATGWASAHVVGQSMGGLIALDMAFRARERIRSLTLVCSFPRGMIALPSSRAMLWQWVRVRAGTKEQRRKALLELVMPKSALATADHERLAAELAVLFGHDLADHPPVATRQLFALMRYDVTTRLHQLAGLPTLIINAEHDRIAPCGHGLAMADSIPGARFVEIPNASHAAAIQHASSINALLAEHFG
jgi:pimeloyl-ACP methyl ester carboxylesterase